VKYSPREEKQKGVYLPVCKKPLTVGVESRGRGFVLHGPCRLTTSSLGKKPPGSRLSTTGKKKRKPFVSIIPLIEVMNEMENGFGRERRNAPTCVRSTNSVPNSISLLKIPYDTIERFRRATAA
jgi:hypothetical protein